MSKSEAIKSATRGPKPVNATPESMMGDAIGVPTPVKRERKPRDPNAPKRVKPTIETELAKLRARYEPELEKQRAELHELDVKRAALAATLRASESRVARLIAVLGEPNEANPPATDPTYGDNKPENDGEKLPEPVNPTGDPRFEPPAPEQIPPGGLPTVIGDPNNQ